MMTICWRRLQPTVWVFAWTAASCFVCDRTWAQPIFAGMTGREIQIPGSDSVGRSRVLYGMGVVV
ncbi:MAG: hypothetical protein JJ992_14300, partial [Planctomycetes bacterium]|nr:hypothetical protein [Planctomycetota bacterium]